MVLSLLLQMVLIIITDAGSSLAAFLGFRLAAIGGGKNHPFGMAVMNGLWGSYLHLLFL